MTFSRMRDERNVENDLKIEIAGADRRPVRLVVEDPGTFFDFGQRHSTFEIRASCPCSGRCVQMSSEDSSKIIEHVVVVALSISLSHLSPSQC